MAAKQRRGAAADAAAVPLADGRTEDRAAKGKQGGVRFEHSLKPKHGGSTGFLDCFVV